MSEYSFSYDGYRKFVANQERIAKWAEETARAVGGAPNFGRERNGDDSSTTETASTMETASSTTLDDTRQHTNARIRGGIFTPLGQARSRSTAAAPRFARPSAASRRSSSMMPGVGARYEGIDRHAFHIEPVERGFHVETESVRRARERGRSQTRRTLASSPNSWTLVPSFSRRASPNTERRTSVDVQRRPSTRDGRDVSRRTSTRTRRDSALVPPPPSSHAPGAEPPMPYHAPAMGPVSSHRTPPNHAQGYAPSPTNHAHPPPDDRELPTPISLDIVDFEPATPSPPQPGAAEQPSVPAYGPEIIIPAPPVTLGPSGTLAPPPMLDAAPIVAHPAPAPPPGASGTPPPPIVFGSPPPAPPHQSSSSQVSYASPVPREHTLRHTNRTLDRTSRHLDRTSHYLAPSRMANLPPSHALHHPESRYAARPTPYTRRSSSAFPAYAPYAPIEVDPYASMKTGRYTPPASDAASMSSTSSSGDSSSTSSVSDASSASRDMEHNEPRPVVKGVRHPNVNRPSLRANHLNPYAVHRPRLRARSSSPIARYATGYGRAVAPPGSTPYHAPMRAMPYAASGSSSYAPAGAAPYAPQGPTPYAPPGSTPHHAPRTSPLGPLPQASVGHPAVAYPGPSPLAYSRPSPLAHPGPTPLGPSPLAPAGFVSAGPPPELMDLGPASMDYGAPTMDHTPGIPPPCPPGPYANGVSPPYANGISPPYANGISPPYPHGISPYASGASPPYVVPLSAPYGGKAAPRPPSVPRMRERLGRIWR
ncbi:hypothetical protein FB107DRAFT_277469 [Schizophyllum commune]